MLLGFDPTHWPDFSTDFWLLKKKNLDSDPHRNCRCICELDVRLLNHPNWTSTARVMVHFPILPQLWLFISLCPNFETGFQC